MQPWPVLLPDSLSIATGNTRESLGLDIVPTSEAAATTLVAMKKTKEQQLGAGTKGQWIVRRV